MANKTQMMKGNIETVFSADSAGVTNSLTKASHRYYYKQSFVMDGEDEKMLTFCNVES